MREWAEKTCEQGLSVAAEGVVCVRAGMRTSPEQTALCHHTPSQGAALVPVSHIPKAVSDRRGHSIFLRKWLGCVRVAGPSCVCLLEHEEAEAFP